MKGNIDPEQLQQNREHIGVWLRVKREEKGLSQTGLADAMGIAPQTISKIEAGKWAISVDMLSLFCKHLGISVKKLFT